MSSKFENVQLIEVAISSINPNPYRDMKNFPFREDKLDALEASMEETGFWGNIICRPNGKGFQMAYGHHRLEVLKNRIKQKKAQVLVKELSNEQMLKMMSYENHEAFGSDAWVEMEDIRQTIGAYDREEIELPPLSQDAKNAANVLATHTSGQPYTRRQIARFLGRVRKDGKEGDYGFEQAWKTLDLIKLKILTHNQFKGLKREEMAVVATHAFKTYRHFMRWAKESDSIAKDEEYTKEDRSLATKEAAEYRKEAVDEARKIGKAALEEIRSGKGIRGAREAFAATIPGNPKSLDVTELAEFLADRVSKILPEDGPLSEEFQALKQHKGKADRETLEDVCLELSRLVKRTNKIERIFSCRKK